MNKKIKRSLISLLLFLGVFGVTAFANPMKHNMFMGEVVKVQKCEGSKETKLLVCGYLKGCEITKTQMIITVDKDTEVKDSCNKKEKDIEIKQGDMIGADLDGKITKSIPPQATAKKVYVSKVKPGNKREDVKTESTDAVRVENAEDKIEEKKSDDKKVEAPKAEEKSEEKSELK